MISTEQAAQLRRLITARCKAERADEMKGTGDEDDREQTEAELKEAKSDLQTFIAIITAK